MFALFEREGLMVELSVKIAKLLDKKPIEVAAGLGLIGKIIFVLFFNRLLVALKFNDVLHKVVEPVKVVFPFFWSFIVAASRASAT